MEISNGNAKESLIYLSHITWNWIKQRPQYIAEELAKSYDLTYVEPQVHKDRGLKQNDVQGLALRELPRVPTLGDRLKFVVKYNDRVARRTVANLLRNSGSRLVWVASPVAYKWLPDSYEGAVIYDCMDDHSAFVTGSDKEEIDRLEQALVKRADLVLASSARLSEKIVSLCPTKARDRVLIVRNAFDGKAITYTNESHRKDSAFKACYFGTIGPWFDFECIAASLRTFPGLSYKIIGPVDEGVEILDDSRIEYTGPVAHEELADFVSDCSCFVMPFVVNDVVLSVDPVKMYEYINYGKDIVCVSYPEVERFSDFAELYNGSDGYCSALEAVMERGRRKYTDKQRTAFLADSSWMSRIEPVLHALGEIR